MKNTSGFQLGDRIKMKSSIAVHLADDIEGVAGTVIDFASREKYPWLLLNPEQIGRAIVKLDNDIRCGEFATHPEQDGCVLAKEYENAILIGNDSLNISEII